MKTIKKLYQAKLILEKDLKNPLIAIFFGKQIKKEIELINRMLNINPN
jgi:hypothetical protein